MRTAYYATEKKAAVAWNTRPGEDAALDRVMDSIKKEELLHTARTSWERGFSTMYKRAIAAIEGEKNG